MWIACIIIVLDLVVRQTFVIPVARTMHVPNVTRAGAGDVNKTFLNVRVDIAMTAMKDAAWSALRRRE